MFTFLISQLAELRAKLNASKDHNAAQKKMMDDLENERRRLELQILNLKEDLDIAYVGWLTFWFTWHFTIFMLSDLYLMAGKGMWLKCSWALNRFQIESSIGWMH